MSRDLQRALAIVRAQLDACLRAEHDTRAALIAQGVDPRQAQEHAVAEAGYPPFHLQRCIQQIEALEPEP